MQPLAMPDTIPQLRINCQGSRMARLAADERLIIARAMMMVVRMPKRCIAAAAKGPVRPNRKMPMPAAMLMVPRDQPKAWPQGTISTPGVERSPAAASREIKTMPTTAKA